MDRSLFNLSYVPVSMRCIRVIFIMWLSLISLALLNYQAVVAVVAVTAFFCFISCSLTEKKHRSCCLQLYMMLLFLQTLLILLLQSFPSWTDVPPDALNYHLHGEALALHLKGVAVEGNLYSLQLLPGQIFWKPDSTLNFPYVVGSTHFLYQAYVGFVYYLLSQSDPQAVILTHAAMLAALPILTFQVAFRLLNRNDVALLAAFLVVVDVRFSVNAVWLLKDTLLTFSLLVFLVYFSAALKDKSRFSFLDTVGMTAALGTIFCLRSHVALAICFLMTVFVIYQCLHKRDFYLSFLLVIAVAFFFSGFFKLPVWDFSTYQIYLNALAVNISSLMASASIVADTGHAAIAQAQVADPSIEVLDVAVESFYQRLVDEPLVTTLQAIARTLFAPYPWVVLSNGFSGSAYDLYFPGMVLWVLSLPFLLLGILSATKRADVLQTLLLIFVALVAAMYLVTYGEFSTRQRQFVTPVFWVWVAYGVIVFNVWLKDRESSEGYK